MAGRAVDVDIRMLIATWPDQAPRGAVTAFCRRHGLSRSRFYEIRAQARGQGPAAAAAGVLARAPRVRPDLATPAAVEALALQVRKELAEQGWDNGPISVRSRLLELRDQGRDEGLFTDHRVPARASLARIFTRHGAVTPAPNKRPHSSYRRFTFPRVHDCWQLDATEWRLADGRTVVVFQLEDDHSRYLLASHVTWGETSAGAVAVMQAAVTAHRAPVILLTDNGVAMNPRRRGMTSQLAAYAARLGTSAIPSSLYHPQTAGKNERLHQTLKRWLRARPLPADLQQLTDWVATFDDHYNHRRPHQGLDGRTPAQVLASAEHALPPDPPPPIDPPQPARRGRPKRQHPPHELRRARVIANGSVRVVGGYYIGLGVQYAGSHVLTLTETTTITIFDLHGTELRTVQLQPGKIYYGTGKPGGRPRRPRPHMTPSNPHPLSGPN